MLQLNFQKTVTEAKTHAPPHTFCRVCTGSRQSNLLAKRGAFPSEKVVQPLVEVSGKREGRTDICVTRGQRSRTDRHVDRDDVPPIPSVNGKLN